MIHQGADMSDDTKNGLNATRPSARAFTTIATLSCAVMLAAFASPALAQKGKETPPPAGNFQPDNSYRVNANSTHNIDLNLCNNPVTIEAHGDDDTDVDFTITDPRGNQVYQDLDLDDDTVATLTPNIVNGQCQLYHMALRNLGNVYNQVQVSVRSGSTGNSAPSVATYRVEANRDYWVDISLCYPRARIMANGDGDTDVDYELYDRNNRVIGSDFATHDNMDLTINTGSNNGQCNPYRLKMHNLGNVWNGVEVTIWDMR
jgi:hypothetical protein